MSITVICNHCWYAFPEKCICTKWCGSRRCTFIDNLIMVLKCYDCTKEIEKTDEAVSVPSDDPQDIYIFCSKECRDEFFTK